MKPNLTTKHLRIPEMILPFNIPQSWPIQGLSYILLPQLPWSSGSPCQSWIQVFPLLPSTLPHNLIYLGATMVTLVVITHILMPLPLGLQSSTPIAKWRYSFYQVLDHHRFVEISVSWMMFANWILNIWTRGIVPISFIDMFTSWEVMNQGLQLLLMTIAALPS